ncbi:MULTISPECIES: MBL fold metallo-hydrolase [unclassified Yoonia]|uniref:MBL fold metallo-hydrolase n=1 Tax=unclassified Yoonia TaxID=2629118 RepID=UPI002AFE4857|nr:MULTISPECIES: MBL fold metallo-hydrolase [unclassified Yoonia]
MTAPVFANSALVKAPERLVLRGAPWRQRALWVRYGLYLSPVAGPVLIDTGYTAHALQAAGRSAALRFYGRALGAHLLPDGQPEPFLARHGLRVDDITTVIVTHFHADHVSGLHLFPKARFIAGRAGWDALRGAGRWGNLRHAVFPELLPPDFAERLDLIEDKPLVQTDLGMAHDLLGDGALLALALPGHAVGHLGLLFAALKKPLLYAVDTQWMLAALPAARRPGLPAMLVATDRAAHAGSCDLVAGVAASGGDVVLCHDPAPTRYDEPDPCA